MITTMLIVPHGFGSTIAPYLRLFPEPGVCDGMFMAVLRRSG